MTPAEQQAIERLRQRFLLRECGLPVSSDGQLWLLREAMVLDSVDSIGRIPPETRKEAWLECMRLYHEARR